MPFVSAPANVAGPSTRPRSLTALAPLLATLTAEVSAAVVAGRLALPPATAAIAQLAKAARQADAPAPDALLLAVHLVAARAVLLEADAPPALSRALTDALGRLHQLLAAPRPPTP